MGLYTVVLIAVGAVITAINHVLDTVICDCNTPTVILGVFNVDLMDQCSSQCKTLINCLINQRGYTQLLNTSTRQIIVHKSIICIPIYQMMFSL